ncbi:hypothetical protein ABRP93_08170 [Corynebacterium sp. KPL2850]|uniref:hypothetical protein n=1 Tax=Corynebacterium sp. KPL2850 TaxID=3158318 RepID=UPI0032EAB420
MTSQPRRQRRRVFRQSDASEYDRSADSPVGQDLASGEGADAQRIVTIDDAAAEGDGAQAAERGEEFYRENQPPHYGG